MKNKWDKILLELSYRVSSGIPDLTNEQHLMKLWDILKEHKWNIDARVELLKNLDEAKRVVRHPGTTWVTASGHAGKRADGKSQYGMKSKDVAKAYVAGQDVDSKTDPKDVKPQDDEQPTDTSTDKEEPTQESTPGVTSESIDSFDGKEKENTMNGEDAPPGTETSVCAEIGVGYGMGCLSENNNDMAKAEKCLEEKLGETKLGKHGIGDGKKQSERRRGMLQGAKRELQRVKEINEALGWENSKTAHIGGSKASLQAAVDKLRKLGIKEVNGMPIDEYEDLILGGGGGANPTDTMVCIVNEETGEAVMYHTSNKMTANDIISNGSPYKETREVVNAADYNEEEKKKANKAAQEARDNIEQHRADQKKYIQKQQDKMIEDSKDPKIARRAIDRLKGDGDLEPVSESKKEPDKYWNSLMRHPVSKKFMEEKGYDPKNLTPEQEIEVYQHYLEKMKEVSSMDTPPESRAKGGIGADDIQIITRLYGPDESITTGREAREPVFDNETLNEFYDKQTNELNELRKKMNKIKPGSGDKAFSDRMAKRLHLDLADGKDQGGVPNDRIETIMGVYPHKDLKQDKDGNMVQKRGSKGPYYKLDKDGNLTDEVVEDEKDLQDFDCAVVADKETMSHCLGGTEEEKAADGIGVRMDDYDGRKAILYDRENRPIAVQTARSKSGVGGPMSDSIAFHKDFQRCLAKQTKLQGKCG